MSSPIWVQHIHTRYSVNTPKDDPNVMRLALPFPNTRITTKTAKTTVLHQAAYFEADGFTYHTALHLKAEASQWPFLVIRRLKDTLEIRMNRAAQFVPPRPHLKDMIEVLPEGEFLRFVINTKTQNPKDRGQIFDQHVFNITFDIAPADENQTPDTLIDERTDLEAYKARR